jgi:hypothetical protein
VLTHWHDKLLRHWHSLDRLIFGQLLAVMRMNPAKKTLEHEQSPHSSPKKLFLHHP